MAERVVILGGGVAGMSAAHELAERGFEVEVLELRDIPGGKARSMPFKGSGVDGRPDLPAEHGFRFFPGFYRHLPDTMGRIPCPPTCPRDHMVVDHLVEATQMQFARRKGRPVKFDLNSSTGSPITNPYLAFRFLYEYRSKLHIPEVPFGYFMFRILELLLRSDDWFGDFERESWLDFSGATTRFKRNRTYNRYLARGVTRTMVAARADEISARTAGCTAAKLVQSLSGSAVAMDRVLDAPTNDAWIQPWLDHLRSMNVVYRTGQKVLRINCSDGRITGVTVGTPHDPDEKVDGVEVKGDYYIAALPVEMMKAPLVTDEMREADPIFSTLHRLQTRWMNGVMLYLREDVPQVHGHSIYIDTPWALSSISQRQFWRQGLAEMGDGRVRGILSVDVSDWKEGISDGKTAWRSSQSEIIEEVVEQLRSHLEDDPAQHLHDSNLWGVFIDPAITHPNPSEAVNAEPLLINTPHSWQHRPEAETQIENLFLAADYVRTDTDLATMESANEAARKAVNGILTRCGREDLCRTWTWEPPIFKQAGDILDVVAKVRRHLPFIGRGPEPLSTQEFEHLLPLDPGARAADRMLLSATGKLANGDPWADDPEGLESFSRALVRAPEKTLGSFEHEIERPRAEVVHEMSRR